MGPAPDRAPPPLHAVTDDAVLARPGFVATALEVIGIGGPRIALHLRGPRTGGRRLFDVARALIDATTQQGALLMINDRIDVALAAGADGVQLGARGIAIGDARRMLGRGRWIGASVHSADEARAAMADGADFVLAGAVFPTESHPGRPAAGLGVIQDATDAGLPVVGIGGVTPERAGAVMAVGAAGVAAIRGVWDAADVAEAVRRYLRAVG